MQSDVGDIESVKETKNKITKAQEERNIKIKFLLSQPVFREWLWELLEVTKIYNTTSHLDPHGMAIASGKRDVGLWVLKDILKADPDAYKLMTDEFKGD